MAIYAKIIGLIGIALNIWAAIIIDRGSVHGAQMSAYVDQNVIDDLMQHNRCREELRKLGWRLMLCGFAAQGVSTILG